MTERKPGVSAVISTWNKADDLMENLQGLANQIRPPEEIIVVDNHSKDDTVQRVRARFPEVNLIVMPDSSAGACETFNIGFRAVRHEFTAIMDDDVVAPPEWLERIMTRFASEPETTAMISSKVVEPEMPESFLSAPSVNSERYMCTFRGCGTVARSDVIERAGYYDERFFIYGNERDLSARVLNLGYRILQFPSAEIFHKTPFGMKAGKRSLYYHTRNFWLYAFKHCPWSVVVGSAMKLGLKGLGLKREATRGEDSGNTTDATGTIGLEQSFKETPGGLWIAIRASLAAIGLLGYCLARREVCRSPDFKPPLD